MPSPTRSAERGQRRRRGDRADPACQSSGAGQLDRKRIAALVGVTPLTRDSGTLSVCRDNDNDNDNDNKVALVACMRKLLTILNTMVRTARAIHRSALNIARSSYLRCGACTSISVK